MRNLVYEQQICRHSDDLFGSWTAIHSNVSWFICFLNSKSHALFVSSGHIDALLGSLLCRLKNSYSWFCRLKNNYSQQAMRYLVHISGSASVAHKCASWFMDSNSQQC